MRFPRIGHPHRREEGRLPSSGNARFAVTRTHPLALCRRLFVSYAAYHDPNLPQLQSRQDQVPNQSQRPNHNLDSIIAANFHRLYKLKLLNLGKFPSLDLRPSTNHFYHPQARHQFPNHFRRRCFQLVEMQQTSTIVKYRVQRARSSTTHL